MAEEYSHNLILKLFRVGVPGTLECLIILPRINPQQEPNNLDNSVKSEIFY
jgi:hypothetical protein